MHLVYASPIKGSSSASLVSGHVTAVWNMALVCMCACFSVRAW